MTEPTKPGPAAIAAANWWAKAVQSPVFDNGGDPMTGMLASLVNATKPSPTVQQQSSFAVLLANRIQADFDRRAQSIDDKMRDFPVTLSVDYGPEAILAEPAREAGIRSSFPWKTCMWARRDYVTVSAGRAATPKLVWASDEWQANRPTCGHQSYDEVKAEKLGWRKYSGEPWQCSLPKYHEEREHVHDAPLALCVTCGSVDDWLHDEKQNGHMPDFHEFVAPAPIDA